MSEPTPPPSARTRIRRSAERAVYDRASVYSVVDGAWHCHVAFVDGGDVHCIPTACWRIDDHLYMHGSNGSRMFKALASGTPVCVTVTHLDGLVLARSAFNHSMNYRSVVIYGRCERVSEEEKPRVLERFMRQILPGREAQARPGNPKELAATTVVRLSLAEAAAKIRTGPPEDDAEDMELPVWAGVLPLELRRLEPERDPQCDIEPPEHVRRWTACE